LFDPTRPLGSSTLTVSSAIDVLKPTGFQLASATPLFDPARPLGSSTLTVSPALDGTSSSTVLKPSTSELLFDPARSLGALSISPTIDLLKPTVLTPSAKACNIDNVPARITAFCY
jgi:hypothetical protein